MIAPIEIRPGTLQQLDRPIECRGTPCTSENNLARRDRLHYVRPWLVLHSQVVVSEDMRHPLRDRISACHSHQEPIDRRERHLIVDRQKELSDILVFKATIDPTRNELIITPQLLHRPDPMLTTEHIPLAAISPFSGHHPDFPELVRVERLRDLIRSPHLERPLETRVPHQIAYRQLSISPRMPQLKPLLLLLLLLHRSRLTLHCRSHNSIPGLDFSSVRIIRETLVLSARSCDNHPTARISVETIPIRPSKISI